MILMKNVVRNLLLKQKRYFGVFKHQEKLANRTARILAYTSHGERQLVLLEGSSIFLLFVQNAYSYDVPLKDDDSAQNILGTV